MESYIYKKERLIYSILKLPGKTGNSAESRAKCRFRVTCAQVKPGNFNIESYVKYMNLNSYLFLFRVQVFFAKSIDVDSPRLYSIYIKQR